MVIAAIVIAVAYVAVDRFVLSTRRSETEQAPPTTPRSAAPAPSTIPAKSVAVLPFVDMSEKKDQEYLSDGLSEELINLLAKVPEISVPARTSSFYFKVKQTTIAEIAKTLGVAHVLEGSVRKAGNIVRITTQLIRVTDGYQVWSETYDRDMKDIFRLQDDIAANVVQALKVRLITGPMRSEGTTTNLDAYSLTLQGRLLIGRGAESDMRQAISIFERAVSLDPSYAPAWVGLSDAYLALFDYGYTGPTENLPKARAAAEKAVALAPGYGAAHRALGWAKLYSDYDWLGARAELDAARRARLVREALKFATVGNGADHGDDRQRADGHPNGEREDCTDSLPHVTLSLLPARRRAARLHRQSSAISSSTLAAWPSARTWYQARWTLPFGPTKNVERIVPTVFLPYIVFSPHAPYFSITFLSASVRRGNLSLYLVRNFTCFSALSGEIPSTATPAFSKVLRLSLN